MCVRQQINHRSLVTAQSANRTCFGPVVVGGDTWSSSSDGGGATRASMASKRFGVCATCRAWYCTTASSKLITGLPRCRFHVLCRSTMNWNSVDRVRMTASRCGANMQKASSQCLEHLGHGTATQKACSHAHSLRFVFSSGFSGYPAATWCPASHSVRLHVRYLHARCSSVHASESHMSVGSGHRCLLLFNWTLSPVVIMQKGRPTAHPQTTMPRYSRYSSKLHGGSAPPDVGENVLVNAHTKKVLKIDGGNLALGTEENMDETSVFSFEFLESEAEASAKVHMKGLAAGNNYVGGNKTANNAQGGASELHVHRTARGVNVETVYITVDDGAKVLAVNEAGDAVEEVDIDGEWKPQARQLWKMYPSRPCTCTTGAKLDSPQPEGTSMESVEVAEGDDYPTPKSTRHKYEFTLSKDETVALQQGATPLLNLGVAKDEVTQIVAAYTDTNTAPEVQGLHVFQQGNWVAAVQGLDAAFLAGVGEDNYEKVGGGAGDDLVTYKVTYPAETEQADILCPWITDPGDPGTLIFEVIQDFSLPDTYVKGYGHVYSTSKLPNTARIQHATELWPNANENPAQIGAVMRFNYKDTEGDESKGKYVEDGDALVDVDLTQGMTGAQVGNAVRDAFAAQDPILPITFSKPDGDDKPRVRMHLRTESADPDIQVNTEHMPFRGGSRIGADGKAKSGETRGTGGMRVMPNGRVLMDKPIKMDGNGAVMNLKVVDGQLVDAATGHPVVYNGAKEFSTEGADYSGGKAVFLA